MNFNSDSTNSYWLAPDFLLLELVSMFVNKAGAEIGVTLMIKGAFLTGTLVGERVYLQSITDLFKTMMHDNIPEEMMEQSPVVKAIVELLDFTTLAEDVYLDEIDEDDEDDEDFDDQYTAPLIRYLHLRDPMMIHPGAVLNFAENPLPIMRIRLSAVDGWMAGRLMTMEESTPDDDSDSTNGLPFDRTNRIQ